MAKPSPLNRRYRPWLRSGPMEEHINVRPGSVGCIAGRDSITIGSMLPRVGCSADRYT